MALTGLVAVLTYRASKAAGRGRAVLIVSLLLTLPAGDVIRPDPVLGFALLAGLSMGGMICLTHLPSDQISDWLDGHHVNQRRPRVPQDRGRPPAVL